MAGITPNSAEANCSVSQYEALGSLKKEQYMLRFWFGWREKGQTGKGGVGKRRHPSFKTSPTYDDYVAFEVISLRGCNFTVRFKEETMF